MTVYVCEGMRGEGCASKTSSCSSARLSLGSLPLSWQKGSCVWLPGDNREEEEGEEVFKEGPVINDCFLYNSRIFLEVPFLLPCPQNNGDELFQKGEG